MEGASGERRRVKRGKAVTEIWGIQGEVEGVVSGEVEGVASGGEMTALEVVVRMEMRGVQAKKMKAVTGNLGVSGEVEGAMKGEGRWV